MNKAEIGHTLAYLIWDAESLEELKHLHAVFDSCMKVRQEHLMVLDGVLND